MHISNRNTRFKPMNYAIIGAHRFRRLVMIWLALPLLFIPPGMLHAEIEIADKPMVTHAKPAPPSIMFVLDDSSSMNFEVLVEGEYDGYFPNPNEAKINKDAIDLDGEELREKRGYCYIFNYLGEDDTLYDEWDTNNWPHRITWRYIWKYNPNATNEEDKYDKLEIDNPYWKSRYYGTNPMYYNPNITYTPWPGLDDFKDADIDRPLSNPAYLLNGKTESSYQYPDYRLDLSRENGVYATLDGYDIFNAHYFIVYPGKDPKSTDDDQVYLVVLDDVSGILYYEVALDDQDYRHESAEIDNELTDSQRALLQKMVGIRPAASIPDEIRPRNASGEFRSYKDERQNFANWYSFYRRREFAAKAALGNVILNLSGVRVGVLGINGRIVVPLKPVKVKIDGQYMDQTEELLAEIYFHRPSGGTPLREGLNRVGEYFEYNSLTLDWKGEEKTGDKEPWFPAKDGGACQKCFAIVVTDGYYGYYKDWDKLIKVGDVDGDEINNPYYIESLADSLSNTLADVAMYYYKEDLRPDDGWPDHVKPYGFDQATHQHMATFGVAFGIKGSLPDPANYDLNLIYDDELTVGWPSEILEKTPETIDDLWHATLNGRGRFLSAKDPGELSRALTRIGNEIQHQATSAASATVSGDPIYGSLEEDTYIFQSLYQIVNDEWLGDVRAYSIDPETKLPNLEEGEWVWSATEELDNTFKSDTQAWEKRKIASYNSASQKGIAFTYGSDMSDQQREDLG